MTVPAIPTQVRYDDEDFINFLIYAPFGAGKTILGASAELCPDMSHVFLADAEGGKKSIKEFGITIDAYRINTFKAFNTLYEFCRIHIQLRDEYYLNDPQSTAAKDIQFKMAKNEAWIKQLKEEPKLPTIYWTVMVDSLTEVQKYAMYHILGIDINTISLDTDIAIPQIQHWGKNAEMIRLLVRSFRDLRMHTIFTTLDMADKDERDGSIIIAPSLPGKLSNEIGAFMDVVGYLHVVEDAVTKEPKRILQVQPAGKFKAKCRFASLGTHVEHPDMTKIMKTIKGGSN